VSSPARVPTIAHNFNLKGIIKMSDLSMFFKKNKPVAVNEFFAATKSLVDAEGAPLLWELRRLTTAQNSLIQDESMQEVRSKGKRTEYRLDTTLYLSKLVAASVVFPELRSSELMDSYGVGSPWALVMEMVDNPGEWNALVAFIQGINGFDVSLSEDVDDAKNS
jgi:hypothetical protein